MDTPPLHVDLAIHGLREEGSHLKLVSKMQRPGCTPIAPFRARAVMDLYGRGVVSS